MAAASDAVGPEHHQRAATGSRDDWEAIRQADRALTEMHNALDPDTVLALLAVADTAQALVEQRADLQLPFGALASAAEHKRFDENHDRVRDTLNQLNAVRAGSPPEGGPNDR
jgi:hypothetical protein